MHNTSNSGAGSADGPLPPWHRPASAPVNSISGANRRDLVQGGGARVSVPLMLVHGGAKFHRVQHDAVAKVALTALTKDLQGTPLRCDIRLLQHVLSSDRKCTLACFQSRCRLQRLRALAAAFHRIGLAQHHTTLLQFVTQTQHSQNQHVDSSTEKNTTPCAAQCATFAHTASSPMPSQLPSRDSVSDHPQQCTSAGKLIEELTHRVAALEAWAHTLDSVSSDDPSDCAVSCSKATEVIHRIAHQAVSKYASELPCPPDDALMALSIQLDEKIEAAIASMDLNKVPPEKERRVPQSSAIRVPQPADGLCLYHSLAAGLANGTSPSALKHEVAAYANDGSLDVAGVSIRDWQSWESAAHSNEPGNADQPPAHWGGAVEIATFASLKGAFVRVFHPPSVPDQDYVCVAAFGNPSSMRCIDVLYSSGNHYDLLVVAGTPVHTSRQLAALQESVAMLAARQDTIAPRLEALDKVHKHLTDRAVSLRGQGVPDAPAICAKIAAIEKRVDAVSSSVPSQACPLPRVTGVDPRLQSSPAHDIQPLLKAHTEAIVETWKWTSSLLLAFMQQRSTNLQVHQILIDHETQFARLAANACKQPNDPHVTAQPVSSTVSVQADIVATDIPKTATLIESHSLGDVCPGDSSLAPQEVVSAVAVHDVSCEVHCEDALPQVPVLASASSGVPMLVRSDTDDE
eukprot:4302688-Amphidinium_carterae.1